MRNKTEENLVKKYDGDMNAINCVKVVSIVSGLLSLLAFAFTMTYSPSPVLAIGNLTGYELLDLVERIKFSLFVVQIGFLVILFILVVKKESSPK